MLRSFVNGFVGVVRSASVCARCVAGCERWLPSAFGGHKSRDRAPDFMAHIRGLVVGLARCLSSCLPLGCSSDLHDLILHPFQAFPLTVPSCSRVYPCSLLVFLPPGRDSAFALREPSGRIGEADASYAEALSLTDGERIRGWSSGSAYVSRDLRRSASFETMQVWNQPMR